MHVRRERVGGIKHRVLLIKHMYLCVQLLSIKEHIVHTHLCRHILYEQRGVRRIYS